MKESKILLFAGTTEGRELAEYLVERKVKVHACVEEYYRRAVEANPKDANNLGNYAVFLKTAYEADPDAEYVRTVEIDLSQIEPTVAFPHLPENAHPISQVGQIKIDQVVIGSCTNGRISDMRDAAEVLKGRKVAKGVRCIVLPATPTIWRQAMKEGLFDIFTDAGCIVGPPTCATKSPRFVSCARTAHV